MKNGIVYCYENLENGKKYVGQTLEETSVKRFLDHEKGKSGCKVFNLAMKKYGKDSFVRYILEDEIPTDDGRILLGELEQYWVEVLEAYTKGYNMTTGGELNKRFNHSEETKKQIAENSPKIWLGKNLSEETKAKISDARKKQAPLTEEQEMRRRESLKKAYAEGKRTKVNAKKLIRLDTLEVFDGSAELVKNMGAGTTGGVRSAINKYGIETSYGLAVFYFGVPIMEYTFIPNKVEATRITKKMPWRFCKRPVRCIETGEVFDSMVKAVGKDLSVDMPDAIKRNRPLCGKHWEYMVQMHH